MRGANYWLDEALSDGTEPELEPLEGSEAADVAIVGAGYTGLWTAYALTQRAPEARVVVLEQDRCGRGPSGRNGGFLHGWWDQLPLLVELFGPRGALALADAADASVSGVADFCAEHQVDAWFRRGGYLRTSTASAHDGDWRPAIDACRSLGREDAFRELGGEEVRRRCASPLFRGGAYMPNAATVQPARLALGLRRVLLERGVRIYEGTRVTRISVNRQVRLRAARGEVSADRAVLAINAWAAGWPGFRTALMSWGSWIVLSEPIPDRLSELGWVAGEAITDSRFTVRYFRTTPDGRIAFGSGVGAVGYGGRTNGDRTDHEAVRRTAAGFRHLFPMLDDVRLELAWGGPIDISSDRVPAIRVGKGGRLLSALGYSGNGVGPTFLAGRILTSLLTDAGDPVARLPLVGHRARPFPPEPFRYPGARVVRRALIRRDDAIEQERMPGLPTRAVAALPKLLGYRLGPRPSRSRRTSVAIKDETH